MTNRPPLSENPDATIYERMLAIQADLPPIAKESENTQQNYMFRGIDAVLNALNPLLAKHGVMPIPSAGEMRTELRTSGRGNAVYCSYVHMTYTWVGLAGDSIVSSFWGEGTDSLDKATSKAEQMAYKYCLFQAFAISTKEVLDHDSDKDGGEPTLPKWMGPIVQRLNTLPPDYKGKAVTAILKANKQEPGQDIVWESMTNQKSWEPWFTNLLDKAEAAIAKAQQDADAEAAAKDEPSPEPESQVEVGERGPEVTAPPQAEPDPTPAPAPDPEPEPAPVPPEDDRPVADPTPPPSGESTAEQDIQYEEVCAEIDTMKGPALQSALRDLDLPVGGSVPELKKRLKEAVRERIYNPSEDDGDEEAEDGGESVDYSSDGYADLEGVPIASPQVKVLQDEIDNLGENAVGIIAEFCSTYPTDLDSDIGTWDQAAAMRFLEAIEGLEDRSA